MAIKTWLVGNSMAISLATSSFTSTANAEPIGGVRPSEGLQAPAFGQTIADSLDQALPLVGNGLNEAVIDIPEGDIALETTVFKPDGAGPFPMIVFNHGKLPSDSHAQPRNRPVALARKLVRHGYVVVVPNRRGFAGSGGQYAGHGCNVEANGYAQAKDVAATVDYMSAQSYIDKMHIVVAGTSHGGLTTIAYGARDAVAAPGVQGLINFSGSLRQDECEGWQKNLVGAFGDYGQNVRLPSLWFYGDNDSVWQGDLHTQMYAAYTAHGAREHGRFRQLQERCASPHRRPRQYAGVVAARQGFPCTDRHADHRAVSGRRTPLAEGNRLREPRCDSRRTLRRRLRARRLS